MDFRMLGPMEVRRVLTLRGPHQRRPLAVPLHESDRLVNIDRLERAYRGKA